jgi:hypothetical protein
MDVIQSDFIRSDSAWDPGSRQVKMHRRRSVRGFAYAADNMSSHDTFRLRNHRLNVADEGIKNIAIGAHQDGVSQHNRFGDKVIKYGNDCSI